MNRGQSGEMKEGRQSRGENMSKRPSSQNGHGINCLENESVELEGWLSSCQR